jgi:hypothetical protein
VTAVILACLAVLAAGTSDAFVPHWGRCLAVPPGEVGHYSDAACTMRTSRHGGYAWRPLRRGQHLGLTLSPLTSGVRFETASGARIECLAAGAEGEMQPFGPTGALTPLWELEGCEAEGQECHTQGAALLGEIDDIFQWLEKPVEVEAPKPGWTGKLGVLTGPPSGVGVEYTARNNERLLDPIDCRGSIGALRIGGGKKTSLIATLTPVNTMTSEITETYAESRPGIPYPANLERHDPAVAMAFVGSRWEQIAISGRLVYQMEPGGGQIEVRILK